MRISRYIPGHDRDVDIAVMLLRYELADFPSYKSKLIFRLEQSKDSDLIPQSFWFCPIFCLKSAE